MTLQGMDSGGTKGIVQTNLIFAALKLTGSQGSTGITGPTGVGITGPTGAGNTGATGPTGPSGATWSPDVYYADDFYSPCNSNWAITTTSPASADTVNSSLIVRRFDDTAEEGVGILTMIPSGVTNLTFTIKGRAQTAPASSKGVIMRLYTRQIPDGSAVTSWSSALQMSTLTVTADTNFHYFTQTISLSTLGLTAGRETQLELTRYGASASDTLVGDFDLLSLEVDFS
jgi:hypothetical protein